jgi:hypothetical protein
MLRGVDVYDEHEYLWRPIQGDGTDIGCRLPRSFIIQFLRENKVARLGFNTLRYGNTVDWTEREIARLDECEHTARLMEPNYQAREDAFQANMNKGPIYTTGTRGGGRIR